LLDIRPVYHWKDRRVKTHIFLCLLAQTVLNDTKKCLKKAGWFNKNNNTLQEFIDKLSEIKLGKFVVLGKEILHVQKENSIQNLLKKAFNLQPFDFKRDKELCGL
jgi:transposase